MDFRRNCHLEGSWNVVQQRAVQQKRVVKDYAMLSADELDEQSGCSVCAEDQQTIRIDGIPEFAVCKRYAPAVRDALASLVQQGQKINSVIAYRVGRTRGEIDAQGNRTGFSNHSYGIAIDINTNHNGLYGNCIQFGAQCQLMRGGPWRPGDDPYSLQQDSPIVSRFKAIGFK